MKLELLDTAKAKRIISASAKSLMMTTFGRESELSKTQAESIIIDHLASGSKLSLLDFAKSRKVTVQ